MACLLRSGRYFPVLLILAGLLIGAAATSAKPPDIWGDLDSGPYAVGFKTIEKYDYSRSYGPKYDYFGNKLDRELARPIQVVIWYPAEAEKDAMTMTFAEYTFPYPEDSRFMDFLAALQVRSNNVFTGLFGGDRGMLMDLMSVDVGAVRDAPSVDGSFPLVLYCPDEQGGASHGFILCEYLASHGFVVASTSALGTGDINTRINPADLETIVRDMEFTLGIMHDFPLIDGNKTAVVGVGLGGLVALLMPMHNSGIDAVVSLDGLQDFSDFHELARSNPYFNPDALAVPSLEIYTESHQPADLSLSETLEYSDNYRAACNNCSHFDFSSYGSTVAMFDTLSDASQAQSKHRHEVICTYVKNFLKDRLVGDLAAAAFMKNKPEDNGIEPGFMILTRSEGKELPPTVAQYAEILQSSPIDTAVALAERFDLFNPEHPIIPEATGNALGYQFLQGGSAAEAVALFRMVTWAYPNSANAWDSYGEACVATGDVAEALRSYEKAMEIIPDDTTTDPALKAMIEANAPTVIETLKARLEAGE